MRPKMTAGKIVKTVLMKMMNLKKMAMKTMRTMKTDFCVRFRAIDDFLCVDVVDYTNISHEDKGKIK